MRGQNKSSGVRYGKVETNHLIECAGQVNNRYELEESHNQAGYNRTWDALTSKIDKLRHTRIIKVNYSLNRDFKPFETDHLINRILELKLNLYMLASDDRHIAELAIYYERTPENVKKEIEKQKLVIAERLLEMTTDTEKNNPFTVQDDTKVEESKSQLQPNESLTGNQLDLPAISKDKLIDDKCVSILHHCIKTLNPKIDSKTAQELAIHILNCQEVTINNVQGGNVIVGCFSMT